MTGEVIKEGAAEEICTINAELEYSYVKVYLVEGSKVTNKTAPDISVFYKIFDEMLSEKLLEHINMSAKI